MANAAGTDSCVARLVPTSWAISSIDRSASSASTRCVAHSMRRDTSPCGHPVAAIPPDSRRLNGDRDALPHGRSVEPGAHGGRHRGCSCDRDSCVVRHHARLDHPLDKRFEGSRTHDDPDWGHAHGSTVCCAKSPCPVHRYAIDNVREGEPRRRTEQVEGASRTHLLLPSGEVPRKLGRVDVPGVTHEMSGQEERLLGVVRYRTSDQASCKGMVGVRRLESSQRPISCCDPRARQHLRRHAQGISDREAVESRRGALGHGHGSATCPDDLGLVREHPGDGRDLDERRVQRHDSKRALMIPVAHAGAGICHDAHVHTRVSRR